MKPFLFLLAFLLSVTSVSAQYISIKKLLELQSSNKTTISNYLSGRGWKISSVDKKTDSTRETVEWAYDYKNDSASTWYCISYSEGNTNRSMYMNFSESDCVGLIKQIKSLGFTTYRTVLKKNGGIKKVFKNGTYAIVVNVDSENGTTSYIFSLYAIEDYMNNVDF